MASAVRLLEDALARVGSRRTLAKALGVTKVHVGTVLAGQRGLGPAALLRAARLTERQPLSVLREHGEKALADELEALIGETITPEQRDHLQRWDRLPPKLRQHLSGVIEAWFETKRPKR